MCDCERKFRIWGNGRSTRRKFQYEDLLIGIAGGVSAFIILLIGMWVVDVIFEGPGARLRWLIRFGRRITRWCRRTTADAAVELGEINIITVTEEINGISAQQAEAQVNIFYFFYILSSCRSR